MDKSWDRDMGRSFAIGWIVGGLICGASLSFTTNQRWEYDAMKSGAGGWEWVEGSGKTWVWKTEKVGGK